MRSVTETLDSMRSEMGVLRLRDVNVLDHANTSLHSCMKRYVVSSSRLISSISLLSCNTVDHNGITKWGGVYSPKEVRDVELVLVLVLASAMVGMVVNTPSVSIIASIRLNR